MGIRDNPLRQGTPLEGPLILWIRVGTDVTPEDLELVTGCGCHFPGIVVIPHGRI